MFHSYPRLFDGRSLPRSMNEIMNILCVKLLVLGLFAIICNGNSYDVKVPKSFSFEHKTSNLVDSSYGAILNLVSSYEIDSHMEVVLIGDADAFSRAYVDNMQERLEYLSKVSSFSSPLEHLHEKIIYHTSSGNTIQSSINAVLKQAEVDGTLDPSKVATILNNYHARASTSTTLFIIYRRLTLGNGGYSYSSPISSCKQRTFIAQDASFAWIDISANAHEIQPETGTSTGKSKSKFNIPVPVLSIPMHELKFFNPNDRGHHMNVLVALIHRSGEAFHSFPLSLSHVTTTSMQSSNSNANVVPLELPAKHVVILDITICIEDEGTGHSLCEQDFTTSIVVQELSRIYANSGGKSEGVGGAMINIQHLAFKFGINDEPELAHAVFSSLHHSSSSTATIIDSNELLFWLSSSVTIRKLVHSATWTSNRVEVQVIPVFVLKMPPSVETFIDTTNRRTLSAVFPKPPGGWRSIWNNNKNDNQNNSNSNSKNKNILSSERVLKWPNNAVLFVRSVDISVEEQGEEEPLNGEIASDETTQEKIQNFPKLYCGDSILSAGPVLEVVKEELRLAIKTAMWGTAPANVHYSGSSKGLVEDYLWYTPVSMRRQGQRQDIDDIPVNTAESFADRRAGARMLFIHRAEMILRKFAAIMNEASSVHPPLNSMILFEIDSLGPSHVASVAAGVGFSKSSKPTNANAAYSHATESISSTFRPKSPGLLAEFLRYMDEAAVDFSHMDFLLSEMSLRNAERQVDKLRQRMLTILNTRSGSLTCKTPIEIEREEAVAKKKIFRKMMKSFALELDKDKESGKGEGSEDSHQTLDSNSDSLDIIASNLIIFVRIILTVLLAFAFIFLGGLAGSRCRQMWITKQNKQYL